MTVKILKTETSEEVDALIRKGAITNMPSIHDGWRFNFGKELKNLKNATGYILVTEETPDIIEGCIIFQLIDKEQPYLAMIEIAPHNKYRTRRYQRVAGCLIAFAYRLSVLYGVGHFKAFLQLDVMEEKKEDEIKLKAVYSIKYNAKLLSPDGTTMMISDEGGEALIKKYLPDI